LGIYPCCFEKGDHQRRPFKGGGEKTPERGGPTQRGERLIGNPGVTIRI